MKKVGLSVDVDSVASHLVGYGFPASADDGKAYEVAIPRFLDLLDEVEARCTFFLIASEAKRFPHVVHRIHSRGHEVASHSLEHPVPFSEIDDRRLAVETRQSRLILEDVTGARVLGFRVPGFDLDERIIEAVIRAGYAYDASAYPTVLLPLARWTVYRRRAEESARALQLGWGEMFRTPQIHTRSVAAGSILEVPVCTTPFVRLPYYHTLGFLLPRPLFRLVGTLAATRRANLSYCFHTVDFMGLDEDGLDPRIARHPGMNLALDAKLKIASSALRTLRQSGPLTTLADLVNLAK